MWLRATWIDIQAFRRATPIGGRNGSGRDGDEEVAADPGTERIDAFEELREVGVQAGGQDLVDPAVLEVGLEASGHSQRVLRLLVGDALQVEQDLVHAGGEGARHVGPQDQQLGDALGADDVAVDLAIDLEPRDRTQDRRPVIEVELDVLAALLALALALRLAAAAALALAL